MNRIERDLKSRSFDRLYFFAFYMSANSDAWTGTLRDGRNRNLVGARLPLPTPADGRNVRKVRFDAVRKLPARAHDLPRRSSVLYCSAQKEISSG